MWNDIFNLAIKNGLWAVLFTGLLIFVIKDTANREKKYQQIITELSESLAIVKDIKQNVEDIKQVVFKKRAIKKPIKKNEKDKKNEKQK